MKNARTILLKKNIVVLTILLLWGIFLCSCGSVEDSSDAADEGNTPTNEENEDTGDGTGEQTASGVPDITSISQATVRHGEMLIIDGSGFGTKEQAAPYVWDDASGDDPLEKWDVVYPYTNDASFRFDYRTPSQVSLANGATGGVDLPHHHIQKYICGAHYNSDNLDAYSGWNMGAVKNHQQGQVYTYISYYRTIDPDWHLNTNCPEDQAYNCDHNFKEYDYAEGTGIYGNMHNLYLGNGTLSDPFEYLVWGGNYMEGMNLTIYSVNTDFMTWYPEYDAVYSSAGVPGVGMGWQKVELILKHNSVDGYHKVYQDNTLIWDISLDDDGLAYGERAETVIGGYARENGSAEEYKNNWRYYADVYYDHSLARVMLADHQNYEHATIIEPQIPNQWSNQSITVRVNLGKIPENETAFLFVFNSANTHNEIGIPVMIGD